MSSDNDDDNGDYIPKQNRKRCDFFDSDDELQGGEDGNVTEKVSLETYYSKGKRKRTVITSNSDDSDDDNESSNDNFNLKSKNKCRRGIIYSEGDDDSDESSSSEREEDNDDKAESDNLCPICLGEFENQMVGIPENCQHIFCIDCIKEWSKNVNNCPVDRKKFNLIRVKNSNGTLVEKIVIEDVKMNEDRYEDPPTYCQICNECNREDCMLLCDECDNGYHMDCLTPALECVPIDQWFCLECAPPPIKRARSRSTETCNQIDNQPSTSFVADKSFLDELHERNRHERGRVLGEFSRTTRSRARTVASTRTVDGQRGSQRRGRGSSRGGRGHRGERTASRPKRKKRKKRSTEKKTQKGGRKKTKKNIMKKKIDSELQKVRHKMANEEEELIRPARVSLFGDPMYLDALYDPGEDEKVESPIRSTIVDTPDVVGHILGTFDTLDSSNISVSRDGRGTLVPKVPKVETPERKRTIRFNMPCDNDGGENNDDNACDIIGSILGASDILNPDKVLPSRNGPPKIKIKEEPTECVQLQLKKERNSEGKKRLNRTDDNDDGDKNSSYNGDNKNDNNINYKEGIEKEACIYNNEPATGVKIKVEEPENTSEEVDQNIHNDLFKEPIKVKTEPVDEYSICENQNNKTDISREECNEEKNILLIHMRKRLKETMEKKTKAEKLEKECKQMRVASEIIEYKTHSSLVNVASFKIPKLKKENSEKACKTSTHTETTTTYSKEKSKKTCKTSTNAVTTITSSKKKSEKACKTSTNTATATTYSTTTNTNNYPCINSNLKEEVLPSCHKEGSIAKSGVKKHPPLTVLEKKIKLYNDGVLKHSPKKQKDVSKLQTKGHKENYEKETKEEKYRKEERNKKDHKNEEYKKPSDKLRGTSDVNASVSDLCENKGDIKKTSLSMNDYRNRNLCENLFGDANLYVDLDLITKQGKDRTCKDTGNVSNKTTGNNTKCTNVSGSSLNDNQINADATVNDNTSMGSTQTKSIKTNVNSVDMYSKYINPSKNLYNDNETILTARTSTYSTPTKSSYTISNPSTNIDLNYSISQICKEQGPLGTAYVPVPSVCEEQFIANQIEMYNNVTDSIISDVSEEQTESNLPAIKLKMDVCNQKAKTLEVKDDVATHLMSMTCKEQKLRKDKVNNESNCVSEGGTKKSSLLEVKKDTYRVSKVAEGKCKSSTSFEMKGNVINENFGVCKEQCKSNLLKLKNNIITTNAFSCLSADETNSLKLKNHIVVGHAGSIVYKDKSKSRSLESRNDIMTHSSYKLYKERDKQNTLESKKAQESSVVPQLTKEHKLISLEKNKDSTTRAIPCGYKEQGKSNPLELKRGTAIPFSSHTCKGQSKSNKDIGTHLISHAGEEQVKSNTTGLKTDKLSVISKEQHKSNSLAVKKDIDYRMSDKSKFEKNSPYSVVRPFIQSSNLLTNQTPVAVISPSFRGDTPDPCFKFKEIKTNNTCLNTSLKPNDTSISNHSALRTSAWVLNTSTITNKKKNSSEFTRTNSAKYAQSVSSTKPAIDTMTNTEKNIIFNSRIGEEMKASWKPSVQNLELNQESIDKVKAYLKPYYKKRMLTKDQWKVVVKSAVRVIHSNPNKFSTDEEIRVLVQQYVSSYLKV